MNNITMSDGQFYNNGIGPFPTPLAAYQAGSVLAFDEASVRQYDRDGRLHVRVAPISKANICEYFGREIPNYEALGLDPNRKYKLLRHPEELKKAASSFNSLPLLLRHVPANAANHPHSLTVGTTGSEAFYEHPYLKNKISVWDNLGIGGIEDDSQKELSSSYHYRADMTPGEYEGEAYDGVMRDIVGNHVALVREGRAGDDVVVGDSKPKEMQMTKVLSRKAVSARGAIIAYLMPKLAMDAKVDVTPIFEGVTVKNFAAKKAGIVAGVTKLTTGLLAHDASIADMAKLVDALEKDEVAEGADADPETGEPMPMEKIVAAAPEAMDEDEDEDEEREKRRREFLTGKLSAEDMKAYDELDVRGEKQSPAVVMDAEPPEKPEKDMVSKPAMDAAINEAVTKAKADARAEAKAIRAAEIAVEPYVGKLSLAFDSAAEVYSKTFEMLGVDVKGVHESAYPVILKAQKKPGAKPATPALAMDSKAASSFAERFPEASNIGAM